AMTMLEFDQRAYEGDGTGASFRGAQVDLIGFVGPSKNDGGFIVARYTITCCAADAVSASAEVVGWDGPRPQRDKWVEVTGTYLPGGDGTAPRLQATDVTVIPEQNDPYE